MKSPRISVLIFFSISLSILIESSWSSSIINPSKVKQISSKPRAYVYKGFLTDEECNHLISLAKTELKRSAVADNLSGESKLSEVRTSSGMFIPKGKDPIIAGIEEKISTWTFLPKENGEDIQVLRYEPGQKYDPHYDYFADKVNIARGGHRIATVLMYLTDVEKGGETVFPNAEESSRRRSMTADEDLSDCGRKGIGVKPHKGDALLFFSLHPNAIPDPLSLHGGCPVLEGEKWSATKWIHVDSFDKILGSSDGCTDANDNCERWAALDPFQAFILPRFLLLLQLVYLNLPAEIPKGRDFKTRDCKQRERRMDVVVQMQRSFRDKLASLFREGILDSQFSQLQQLQDESNPDFVVEVVALFFEDSERLLNDLARALEQHVDFKKIDAHVHQLKGSSSSIGAQRVKNACVAFRNYCEEQNDEACSKCLMQVKQEYLLVKNELQTLLMLEQKIKAAGGAIPMIE
ncbi:OLC1v1020265C1 [Oldenlandia corymbosa var. corymbosa]|uniref:procollagen-proline 4-dioxygenase n=1 Tax=Oldenlandia corymbosa var. corymbosa TaxID=529605 RepID=A0AAV1EG71_OLDCO|nr:OLC1v1020265C1 [Oldenlandia corymbosa var. corymbosa]